MKGIREPGVWMITLGLGHNLATPFVAMRYSLLPNLEFEIFVLMFMATGFSVMLCGAIQLRMVRFVELNVGVISSVFIFPGLYVAALGLGAIYIAPWNPVAYVLALIGLMAARQIKHGKHL